MLDKAVTRLQQMGRRLEDFTYDDKDMAEVFFELLKETRFTGVSVSFSHFSSFNSNFMQYKKDQVSAVNE